MSSAVDALESEGVLFTTAARGSKTVHTSRECLKRFGAGGLRSYAKGGEAGDYKRIEHPGQIPLRSTLCDYCAGNVEGWDA